MSQKVQDFQKSVGFPLDASFKNLKGDLSIKRLGKPHKFCNICCFIIVAENKKLSRHCKAHHKDHEPKFLKYGENPISNIYENFDEFLKNSKCDLLLKETDKERMYGRPTKDVI